jgi:hypothetical protein
MFFGSHEMLSYSNSITCSGVRLEYISIFSGGWIKLLLAILDRICYYTGKQVEYLLFCIPSILVAMKNEVIKPNLTCKPSVRLSF